MIYVIKRTDQGGGWLAMRGSRASYTRYLHRARVFHSRDEALGERCPDNEIVQSIEEAMDDAR